MLQSNNAAPLFGKLATPSFGTITAPTDAGADPARQAGGAVQAAQGAEGSPGSILTVVYVPPAEASTVDIKTSMSESVTALNITA
jgi:hypothetical protein